MMTRHTVHVELAGYCQFKMNRYKIFVYTYVQ